jgi:Na+/pantothenate symporter
MLGPISVTSLLVCIFFIGELSPLILRDFKEKSLLLPVVLLLELGLCSCAYLILGLLKDYFLAFSRA